MDTIYRVTVDRLDELWVLGMINEFPYAAKVYDEPSPFGIDNGRVCKLTISTEKPDEEIVSYERGWVKYPETREFESLLAALLLYLNGIPAYQKRMQMPRIQMTKIVRCSELDRAQSINNIKLNYQVSGANRKALVNELAEIVQCEPEYLGAPSFAYKVGNYRVDKDGVIHCPELVDPNVVDEIVERLTKLGFELAEVKNDLTVELPRRQLSDEAIARLELMVANKEALFKRAFQADALPIQKQEDKICFPWFKLTGADGEAEAYAQFISALAKMSRERKRIMERPYTSGNDKYTMRLFLVSLGLKGKDYKGTRKILMRNLTGNGAWKNGAPPERNEDEDDENE